MSSSSSRDFLQRVLPEIQSGGARNIVELAKAMHMPVETTRYKIKGMLKRGLSIHASVDYNKFGLTRYLAQFGLTEKTQSSDRKFFNALSEEAFLISSTKKLPTGEYACEFAFPRSLDSSFSRLRKMIRAFEEERLIKDARVYAISAQRMHTMQPEFFDLKHSRWQIDWNKVKREAGTREKSDWPEPKLLQFDDLDLMIVRELEQNALTRLSDIAHSLKTTLNNIFYHFHKHIVEGKFSDGYTVRWNGTAKQPAVMMQLLFNGLTVSEELSTRSCVARLPFLWTEALGIDSGLYSVQGAISMDNYLEVMDYLSNNLETAKKLEVNILDLRTRLSFPLPAHLYRRGAWEFDGEEVVQHLSRLRK
jgi:DNA-binding Lrp family transcriptional regulator